MNTPPLVRRVALLALALGLLAPAAALAGGRANVKAPPAVMKAAQGAVKNMKIIDVRSQKVKGADAYAVLGNHPGAGAVVVLVTTDGKVLGALEQISMRRAPADLRSKAKANDVAWRLKVGGKASFHTAQPRPGALKLSGEIPTTLAGVANTGMQLDLPPNLYFMERAEEPE
ncbi:MAG: hypothetical protein H6704_13575 [Myxococcales bacterium]|nr:hypothetical protein [Myxococcales bacterium]